MATNNNINTPMPITVPNGGTGKSSITAKATLLGQGASTLVEATGNGNGKPLIGSTGANPVYAAIASAQSWIARTLGAHSLNLDITGYTSTTFTPTLLFGNNAVDMTYTTQVGNYIRLGCLVFYQIHIVLSAKGSSTGTATLAGLPVTVKTGVNYASSVLLSNTSFTTQVIGYPVAATTNLYIANIKTGTTSVLTHANFTDTSEILISGFYPVV